MVMLKRGVLLRKKDKKEKLITTRPSILVADLVGQAAGEDDGNQL
jgi:hypothetical protein